MESKKNNKVVNITKKKNRSTDTENRLVVTSEGGEGQYRDRRMGVKIGYKEGIYRLQGGI